MRYLKQEGKRVKKIANAITSIVLLLFCQSVYGMQIQLFSLTGQGSVSELVFAKTLVETYGYACEEHTALLSSVTIQSRRSDVYPRFFF